MTGRWRTVLVDDVAALRVLVRVLLADNESFEVVGEAADGADGLQVTRRARPDLVLLDLAMPVMDGLEFLAAAHTLEHRPVIVVLSGFAADSTAAAAIAAGAAGYLEKNDMVGSLLPRLQTVLAGHRPAGGVAPGGGR